MIGDNPNYLPILALYAAAGLLPIAAVAVTAFAKISVVFLIVRNAIGIQQTPSNAIIYALAIVLTFHVMLPTASASYEILRANPFSGGTLDAVAEELVRAAEPFRVFLARYSDEASVAFFMDSLERLAVRQAPVTSTDFGVLVPAFLVSELTRAFEIGFLLYLPFVMVDLVVSAILIAMGMQMMSPTIISIPLKLLFFVIADGWSRLIEGLVLSYAP